MHPDTHAPRRIRTETARDQRHGAGTTILIRRSEITDMPALRELARLEGRSLPESTFLVAEADGDLIAAASIDDDAPPLGDPFRHTGDLQHLLARQAVFLRSGRKAA